MPSVAFVTLGCKVNQFETETMEGLFKARGYKTVPFEELSDVYIVNTCSVTHLGERKSRQLIRRAGRTNPAAVIAVTGCYAQVSPAEVAAIEGVDVIVGTQDRHRIVELVEQAAATQRLIQSVGDIMLAESFEDIPLFSAPGRTRAFLKIQEGCANYCSYCIIPYARGPLRSRPIESVLREAVRLVDAGFQEIVLTGIHLGAYGRDKGAGLTLTSAVRAILTLPGLKRLRLSSLESVEVPEDLIGLMQTDRRLCPHLHLPLQAGCDEVLVAMNRHYTTDQFRQLIHGIRQQVPDIAISTDIIVGFPGETDEHFAQTLAFAAEMQFTKIHVFPYSRRKGTPAATFANQVTEPVKKTRSARLQELGETSAREFQREFLGRELEVLFESRTGDAVEGLTGNYIRVFAPGGEKFLGHIRPVKLLEPCPDGLRGEITANF